MNAFSVFFWTLWMTYAPFVQFTSPKDAWDKMIQSWPSQFGLPTPTARYCAASDRSFYVGMVPNWCSFRWGLWVLTQCHLATCTYNNYQSFVVHYPQLCLWPHSRKRTVLITTAPWVLALGAVVMTPERRLVRVVVDCLLASAAVKHFGVLLLHVLAGPNLRKSRSTRESVWCVATETRWTSVGWRETQHSTEGFRDWFCRFDPFSSPYSVGILAKTSLDFGHLLSQSQTLLSKHYRIWCCFAFSFVPVKVGSKDLKGSQVYPWHFSYRVTS